MDDLIFSGAGSGCRDGDDEDECSPPEGGSGDDLITPVYVASTKPPKKEKPLGKDVDGKKPCDDEDCQEASGSGEVTEVFSTSSTVKIGKLRVELC